MIIKMSVLQRSNLLSFMKRVTLTGEEVEAFVEVIGLIQSAEEEKEEPFKTKK